MNTSRQAIEKRDEKSEQSWPCVGAQVKDGSQGIDIICRAKQIFFLLQH